MVTKLYYFRTKRGLLKWCRDRGYSLRACEDAWTGPGYYYARSRRHISKHTPHLDRRRGKKIGRGPRRHIHDLAEAVSRLRSSAKRLARRRVVRTKTEARRALPKAGKAIAARTLRRVAEARRRVPEAVKRLAEELWDSIPARYKRGRNRIWTWILVLHVAHDIYRRAREKGVDVKQYDWRSLLDWAAGYRAVMREIRRILGPTAREIAEEIEARYRHSQDTGHEYLNVPEELDAVAQYELQHLDELVGW